MTTSSDPKHFEGKAVVEHLKKARKKGAKATAETHGTEAPGHISAGADSAKETAVLLLSLWILLSTFSIPLKTILITLGLVSLGWLLWKVGRSAILGWARLERLHRLIEQERWEIEHHRAQEKQELIEMYQQKGFRGELLDRVVEVLMADDNRLLRVMLEEELGLTLESYEHPLKQAFGAGVGVLAAAILGGIGVAIGSFIGLIIALSATFVGATLLATTLEGNDRVKSLVWNVAVGILAVACIYLFSRMIG